MKLLIILMLLSIPIAYAATDNGLFSSIFGTQDDQSQNMMQPSTFIVQNPATSSSCDLAQIESMVMSITRASNIDEAKTNARNVLRSIRDEQFTTAGQSSTEEQNYYSCQSIGEGMQRCRVRAEETSISSDNVQYSTGIENCDD